MNIINGVVSYLGIDIRRDLTEEECSAMLKWNIDMPPQGPQSRSEQSLNNERSTLDSLNN